MYAILIALVWSKLKKESKWIWKKKKAQNKTHKRKFYWGVAKLYYS